MGEGGLGICLCRGEGGGGIEAVGGVVEVSGVVLFGGGWRGGGQGDGGQEHGCDGNELHVEWTKRSVKRVG